MRPGTTIVIIALLLMLFAAGSVLVWQLLNA